MRHALGLSHLDSLDTLAMAALGFHQVTSLPCQQSFIVRNVSVVPRDLILGGLFVPGQIRIQLTSFRTACMFS